MLAKGDPTSGAVLLLLAERGRPVALAERSLGLDDRYVWRDTGPADPGAFPDYLERRRRSDPDLWVVELDIADAARLADELIG